jgi:3-oxoacyl-[acyl-carrier protein] reductase
MRKGNVMTTTKSLAIVTGPSQGIGRATAVRLARDFSVIVLVARDKDKLDQTAAEIRAMLRAQSHRLICSK